MAKPTILPQLDRLSPRAAQQCRAALRGVDSDVAALEWLGAAQHSAEAILGVLDGALATAAIRLASHADQLATTVVTLSEESSPANSVQLAAATRGLEMLARWRKLAAERVEALPKRVEADAWQIPAYPVLRDDSPGHPDPRESLDS